MHLVAASVSRLIVNASDRATITGTGNRSGVCDRLSLIFLNVIMMCTKAGFPSKATHATRARKD